MLHFLVTRCATQVRSSLNNAVGSQGSCFHSLLSDIRKRCSLNLGKLFSNYFCRIKTEAKSLQQRNFVSRFKKLKLKIPSGMNNLKSELPMKVERIPAGSPQPDKTSNSRFAGRDEEKRFSLKLLDVRNHFQHRNFSILAPHPKINQQLFKNASRQKRKGKNCFMFRGGDNVSLL